METADKTITCPTCGIVYRYGAKYCGRDGTPLNMDLQPNATLSKICPGCRTAYPGYAMYCPGDSKKLVDADDPSVAAAVQGAAQSQQALQDQIADKTSLWSVKSQEDEVIGRTVAGKYKIESLLGEGGMAQVFRATHLDIEKPVVIKIMHANLPGMKNAYKRFEQESKVTAKLNHPNIVSVFDGGVLDQRRPYLVMEYIEGQSLRSRLGEGGIEGTLPPDLALTVLIQMCAGLQEAHNFNIVHRDLKPENIMLRTSHDRPDWVKIVDFGIAHLKEGGQKLTATGVAVGTVDYMSPEYLSDKPIDHRADIYAMGVILYELLTGRCPFQSETPEAVMAKHLWTPAPKASSLCTALKPDGVLDNIILKSLAKEPAERYASASEMKKELNHALREFEH